jgi:TyrR family helix-turn-helix protein
LATPLFCTSPIAVLDWSDPIPSISLKEKLAEYEIRIINDTLAVSKSIREAAKQLKLSHTSLLNKLNKYQIKMEIKRTIVNKTYHFIFYILF